MAPSGSAALRFVRTPCVVGMVLLASACGSSTAKDTGALDAAKVPLTITVSSPAFANNAAIPRANSCDGTGTAPTIRWGAIPAAAKTLAVVVDDPDADHFLHWLVVGLPAAPGSVPSHGAGVSELDNTAGTRGWTPPCPPAGSTHHYRFTVYALNDYVCADNGDASNGPDCSPPSSIQALPQIEGSAIAKGVLVGTYRR
jgi:Raf kinase inhibitor-like YbhB/YbcL family protein